MHLVIDSLQLDHGAAQLLDFFFQQAHKHRADAIASTQTVSGVIGFCMTLAAGVLVDYVQKSGNQFMGLNVYAQQVTAALSFVMNLLVILYLVTQIKGTRIGNKEE